MNPHSPEQKYPLSIVENALGRCQQERENAEFLIETKNSLIEIIQQGYAAMNDLDEEIVLSNGVVLPSPRRILEHDVQHHSAVIERQKVLLEEILSVEETLKNAIRRHKQPYDTLNIRRLVRKQQEYDNYETLKANLQTLENNIISLNQDLDRDMKHLTQLHNQATSSSISNSAISNND